jgi:hypothetical protein
MFGWLHRKREEPLQGMSIERVLERFLRCTPASGGAVAKCEAALGKKLPIDHVEFLGLTNGGDGFIGENAYVIFWTADELTEFDRAYEVQEYAPGLLLFASSGGGEAYGWDTRTTPWAVVEVPFVGMDWSLARSVGSSFADFMQRLYAMKPAAEPPPGPVPNLPSWRGREIFEVKPIILGGSPTDPANKTVLDRQTHIKAVSFWNKIIKQVRENQRASKG